MVSRIITRRSREAHGSFSHWHQRKSAASLQIEDGRTPEGELEDRSRRA
jgi:hypothetical protein